MSEDTIRPAHFISSEQFVTGIVIYIVQTLHLIHEYSSDTDLLFSTLWRFSLCSHMTFFECRGLIDRQDERKA